MQDRVISLCMIFRTMVILTLVMNMKNDREMLSAILKSTQMGQVGIRSVMGHALQPELKKALQSQLREYDTIESEAHALASQRGWELTELQPGIGIMSNMMARMRLSVGNADSKIAGMMIQGNTRGMITGLKDLHEYRLQDSQVSALSQRLLDCETANVKQMQKFL